MKNFLIKVLCLSSLTFSLNLQAQSPDSEILGVWKYQAESFEGMSIVTPTHFIWVISSNDRQPFTAADPSAEEKAQAFNTLNIGAGNWESTGERRNKVTYTQHVNASLIGSSFEYEYEMDGDLIKYWVIQQDGKRSIPNQARKLAEWDASGSCSLYNGVWEYEGFGESAVYIQSGNYGAWIILNELVTDVSTTENKAKAFDAINARFVVGDCREGKKDFWNVIHAADSRNEKRVIGSMSKKVEDGYYSWQILNAKGQPVGQTWRTRRLADSEKE